MRREVYEKLSKALTLPVGTCPHVKYLLKKYPEATYDAILSIYSQENQYKVIKSHHIHKANIDKYYARYIAGEDILAICADIDFPPCMLMRRMLEGILKVPKQNINEILKNPNALSKHVKLDPMPEPQLLKRLTFDVHRCVLADCSYSPYSDLVKQTTGMEYEMLLYKMLDQHDIPHWTEAELREQGCYKTPDARLQLPIAIKDPRDGEWRIVSWIDSKATFGDDRIHAKQSEEQYAAYVNRYGSGLVIYWFGYIDDLKTDPEVMLLDKFPDAKDIRQLPRLPVQRPSCPPEEIKKKKKEELEDAMVSKTCKCCACKVMRDMIVARDKAREANLVKKPEMQVIPGVAETLQKMLEAEAAAEAAAAPQAWAAPGAGPTPSPGAGQSTSGTGVVAAPAAAAAAATPAEPGAADEPAALMSEALASPSASASSAPATQPEASASGPNAGSGSEAAASTSSSCGSGIPGTGATACESRPADHQAQQARPSAAGAAGSVPSTALGAVVCSAAPPAAAPAASTTAGGTGATVMGAAPSAGAASAAFAASTAGAGWRAGAASASAAGAGWSSGTANAAPPASSASAGGSSGPSAPPEQPLVPDPMAVMRMRVLMESHARADAQRAAEEARRQLAAKVAEAEALRRQCEEMARMMQQLQLQAHGQQPQPPGQQAQQQQPAAQPGPTGSSGGGPKPIGAWASGAPTAGRAAPAIRKITPVAVVADKASAAAFAKAAASPWAGVVGGAAARSTQDVSSSGRSYAGAGSKGDAGAVPATPLPEKPGTMAATPQSGSTGKRKGKKKDAGQQNTPVGW